MIRALIIVSLLTFSLFAKDKVDRSISHKTFESVSVVQKLLSEDNATQALDKLHALYKSIDNNRIRPYEKAFVKRMFAYVYISMNQYKKAISYFKLAYGYKLFLPKEQQDLLKNIAQLSMALSDYKSAIKYYKLYIEASNIKKPEIYISLASAYNEIGKIDSAIKNVQIAIEISKGPKLSWYEMLLALFYANENYVECIKISESIIQIYGVKKEFLFTLSSLYQYTNNEKKALSTLELAYDMDYFIKKESYIQLAYMQFSAGLPHKSVTTLEDGIKKAIVLKNKESLRLLADSYSYAKEDIKAIKAYKELATITNDGDVYAQIAQFYLNLKEYKQAINYFNKAINSESLKNVGSVYLLLGITHYELKDKKNAKEAMLMALTYDNTKTSAKEWLKFLK